MIKEFKVDSDVLKKACTELKERIDKFVSERPQLADESIEVFRLRQNQWTLTEEK